MWNSQTFSLSSEWRRRTGQAASSPKKHAGQKNQLSLKNPRWLVTCQNNEAERVGIMRFGTTPRFGPLSTYAAQAPRGPATLHQPSSWNLSSSRESTPSRCFHGNGQDHPSQKAQQRDSPKSHIPHGPQDKLIQRIASVSGACAICRVSTSATFTTVRRKHVPNQSHVSAYPAHIPNGQPAHVIACQLLPFYSHGCPTVKIIFAINRIHHII